MNEATGEVTFSVAPDGSPGTVMTWGGAFHRAVHFANDDIEQVLSNLKVSSYNAVQLQEARGV